MAPRAGVGDTGRRVPQRAVAVKARCHEAGPLNSLSFSSGGEELFSAGADGQLKSHKLVPSSAGGGLATGDSSNSRQANEQVSLEESTSRSDHSKAISAVAVSALGDLVATAALDHAVKLYRNPGLKFEGTITRFTLPIRCLSFSASGSILAAAGDDEGIKLISTLDCSIACILKGHDAPVLSVAFDPKNEFLASADADGTVCIWNLSSTKAVHVLKGAASAVESVDTAFSRNTVAWHPDGGLLAVPSRRGAVKCYDRDTAEEMLTLEGEHSASITTVAWSPSGRYLATAAEDGQILVWDADDKLDLNTAMLDAPVSGLAWCPGHNALAACTADGAVALWQCPVPGHMPLPCSAPLAPSGAGAGTGPGSGASQPGKLSREELLKFDDDDDEAFLAAADAAAAEYQGRQRAEDPSVEDSDNRSQDVPADSEGDGPAQAHDGVPSSAVKPAPRTSNDVPWGQARTSHGAKLPGRGVRGVDEGSGRGEVGEVGEHPSSRPSRPTRREPSRNEDSYWIQPAFQPGATPERLGVGSAAAVQACDVDGGDANPHKQKRFLAFNLLGCITSRPDAEFAHIEVEFHDTSAMPCRVPAMVDYYGFTMAALGSLGCVLASPGKAQPKQPSTLLYRPFSSWASNSDWTVRLAGDEKVVAVALGQQWVAAATSDNMLRVFSDTGIQKFVMCLSGPVVALAGQGSSLAVVTHAAACPGQQHMEVAVLAVPQHALKWRAALPLSPGASLTWLGFSAPTKGYPLQARNLNAALSPATDGQGCGTSLATYDSKGIVRVYREEYGGCWVPIFSSEAERKSTAEHHWMVGLDLTLHRERLFFVVCKAPETHPQVYPRPVLSELKASIPLLASDLAGCEELESSLLHTTLQISQMRRQVEAAIVEGRHSEAQEYEDHLSAVETQQDKTLLRLLAAACKGDKLERAVELGSMLVLHKSLEGAVRLASALRLPVLAERLHVMLQDRRALEDREAGELLPAHRGRASLEAEAAQRSGTAPRHGAAVVGREGEREPPQGPSVEAKPATPQPKGASAKSLHEQPRDSKGLQPPKVAEASGPVPEEREVGEGPEAGSQLSRAEPRLSSGGEAMGPAPEHAATEPTERSRKPLKAGQRTRAAAGNGAKGASSHPSKCASKAPLVAGPVENPFAKPPANPCNKGTAGNAADVPTTPGAKDRSSEVGASDFLTSLAAETSQVGAGGKRKAASEAKGAFFKSKAKAST